MKRNLGFEGIDTDKEESLFEYGLLCRWFPPQKSWQVVYSLNNGHFQWSWINEEKVNNFFNESEWAYKYIEEFTKFIDSSITEWNKLSMANKLSDLINYFGHEDVLGAEYYREPMNIQEVCKMVRLKYEPYMREYFEELEFAM